MVIGLDFLVKYYCYCYIPAQPSGARGKSFPDPLRYHFCVPPYMQNTDNLKSTNI